MGGGEESALCVNKEASTDNLSYLEVPFVVELTTHNRNNGTLHGLNRFRRDRLVLSATVDSKEQQGNIGGPLYGDTRAVIQVIAAFLGWCCFSVKIPPSKVLPLAGIALMVYGIRLGPGNRPRPRGSSRGSTRLLFHALRPVPMT
jgi:hypothetical protein